MKKILAILLCLCMVFALAACGGKGEEGGTGTGNPADTSATSAGTNVGDAGSEEKEPDDKKEKVPNKVMACDQHNGKVIVYNLDLLKEGDSLDLAEEWSVDCGSVAGLKYREGTAFGDVVIVAGGTSRIISYPAGETLWSTNNPGTNPHSIEILPGGNIVIANSTGGTVRFFQASAALTGDTAGAAKWKDYPLVGAHGVLWDPEYNVLWAVGDNELVAYQVNGEGTNQSLTQIGGMGAALPAKKNGGHDLAADLTDTRYLYLTTNACVFRYDKEEGELSEKFDQYAKLSTTAVKGFGNNQNGNFFFVFPNHGPGTAWENDGKADWCTDTIHFCYWKTENFMYKQAFVSDTAAFYKCRVFCGQYQ